MQIAIREECCSLIVCYVHLAALGNVILFQRFVDTVNY